MKVSEWLEYFNSAFDGRDRSSTNQIVTDPAARRKLNREADDRRNKANVDAMVRCSSKTWVCPDEFPAKFSGRYSAEDYQTSSAIDILQAKEDLNEAGLCLTPYGGGETPEEGDVVRVCMPCHICQDHLGTVLATRRDEFLIQTKTVQMWCKANEITRITL
jgi:hypothetical protein